MLKTCTRYKGVIHPNERVNFYAAGRFVANFSDAPLALEIAGSVSELRPVGVIEVEGEFSEFALINENAEAVTFTILAGYGKVRTV